MKLRTTRFGQNRHGYAFDKIKACKSGRHLDIGCFDGLWIAEVGTALEIEVHGVDVNKDAIEKGRKACPNTMLHHIQTISHLPFSNQEFDSITLMDVYEHLDVSDQEGVLKEIGRLLRPRGILVITVPGKHLLSFLDLGNLKFRFPRLHRLYVEAKHGRELYKSRYASNPHGLFGDVSVTKRWHEHFGAKDLANTLTSAGFEIVDVDGAGYFMRLICIFGFVPCKTVQRFAAYLQHIDHKLFASANVFITARTLSE